MTTEIRAASKFWTLPKLSLSLLLPCATVALIAGLAFTRESTPAYTDSAPKPKAAKAGQQNSVPTETWKTREHPRTEASAPALSSPRIDTEKIALALDTLKVDEEGNLQVGAEGLHTLYNSMGYGGINFSDEEIASIKNIVLKQLPPPVGQQAAEVVSSFHDYLKAKRALDQLYPVSGTAAQLQIRIAELNALRDLSFGRDLAEQLFKEQRRHEDYMLKNMWLSQDETLSEEEKHNLRQRLSADLLSSRGDVLNWGSRLEAFENQKRAIVAASLSDQEKSAQIDQLLRRSFNETELATMDIRNLSSF